jgi:hypothetical protein
MNFLSDESHLNLKKNKSKQIPGQLTAQTRDEKRPPNLAITARFLTTK